jgi:hypothetical protein
LSLDSYSVLVVVDEDDDLFSRSVSDCFVRFFSSHSSPSFAPSLFSLIVVAPSEKRPTDANGTNENERRRDVTNRDEKPVIKNRDDDGRERG